jgi:hypothetical protein
MAEPVREVPGRKGLGVLYTTGDGYYFVKNCRKKTSSKVYMVCVDCCVRAVVEDGKLSLTNDDHKHSHPPDFLHDSVSKLKEELKKAAVERTDPIKEVFRSVCAK